MVDTNLRVAHKAYDFARERYAGDFDYKLQPLKTPARMVLSGNQAICLGALLGGSPFFQDTKSLHQ